MHILLVSLNFAPEPTGIGLYSGGLAKELARRGHSIRVIAAQPHYPQWRILEGYKATRWNAVHEGTLSVTRCPIYVPSRISGSSRMIHYASFMLSSFLPIMFQALTKSPDIIINIAPSLGVAPSVLMASRLTKAKSWLHIQDFEVEAAFATGNINKASTIGKLASWFEQQVMRRFDAISSISPEMCKKLPKKNVSPDKIYEFRNWAELDQIMPQHNSAYAARWKLAGKNVALYSGNIASKQGIEVLVEVARLMQDVADFHLVICGEGPNRKSLEAKASGLNNISFYDLQPMEQLPDLLALAKIHLLPQQAGAADLVLPSKLANMLASGRPVVAGAAPGTGLAREVEGCGIAVEPDNANSMVSAIKDILADPIAYATYSTAARKRAELRWSKDAIMDSVVSRFNTLLEVPDE